MLPKQNRLTSGDEIRATMKSGQRISNQTLTLHFVAGSGRFAFITPKTLGNAVKRNLVRRRGRAIMSAHLETLSKVDGVLRFHPVASSQTFDEIATSIADLVKRTRA